MRVVVLGDFSGRGVGHSALLVSVLGQLQELDPSSVLIPTVHPRKLAPLLQSCPTARPVGMAPWHLSLGFLGAPVLHAIRKADCLVLADNLLHDKGLLHPVRNGLPALAGIRLIAESKKPWVYYNAGVGPLDTRTGTRLAAKLAAKLDLLLLRDAASADVMERIAPQLKWQVTADSGFDMPWSRLADAPIQVTEPAGGDDGSEGWIGVNLSYHTLRALRLSTRDDSNVALGALAGVLQRHSVQEQLKIRLLVTHPGDAAIARGVADRCPTALTEIVQVPPAEFLAWLASRTSGMRHVIGDRYHELVMFAAAKIPAIGITTSGKVESLAGTIGTIGTTVTPAQLQSPEGDQRLHHAAVAAARQQEAACQRVAELGRISRGAISLLRQLF